MRSLQEAIGYTFKDGAILKQALTHKSYASEHRSTSYNERLEFLGDSVLGLVTAHYVYLADRECPEGKLSKLKSQLVSKPYLCKWGRDIGIGRHLLLGQGEESTGGRDRESLLANAVEAVIGAIYLDGGYEQAQKFVTGWLSKQSAQLPDRDFKSLFQEYIQKKHKVPPDYEIAQTVGPEHNKTFTVTVKLGGKTLGTGRGRNRKEAEQAAAKDAYEKAFGK